MSQSDGFRPIFDGQSLTGWHIEPRIYGTLFPGGPSMDSVLAARGLTYPQNPERHPSAWHVEDGVLIGQQSAPGYGGYLVTDDKFGDFELIFEARPHWPADTGVMLRRRTEDWAGFQVLLDHREWGGIGGFFANGLGNFAAVPFAVRSKTDEWGAVVGLQADDPATSLEPVTPDKIERLAYACRVEDFLDVWKWADWNSFRVRCVGELPVITCWINGLKIAELDTATVKAENYDPAESLEWIGRRGHIALEVHNNDSRLGDARWGPGAKCRWRNMLIKELD